MRFDISRDTSILLYYSLESGIRNCTTQLAWLLDCVNNVSSAIIYSSYYY